jgi:hypothetical protein
MGVEKTTFGGLALVATFCVVAQAYWGIPVMAVLYLLASWLTKKDDQYMAVLIRYMDEGHIYDATPRQEDYQSRPKGWGKGLPL